jgi:hypothetical protein
MSSLWREHCARCGRKSPSEKAAAQGWETFEANRVLIVDVPEGGALLPVEVCLAIEEHGG